MKIAAIARQTGKDWMGRIDPDGRFAVWQSKRMETKYAKVSKATREDKIHEELRVMRGTASAMGVNLSGRRMSTGMQRLLGDLPVGIVPKGPGLSRDANSEKPPSRRGKGGLTRHGARLIRNGGALIERQFGTRTCSMFTGTFPDLTAEQWELVRSNWAKAWDLFMRKITYHLKLHKLYPGIVACFEVQEKRNARTGALGLHVHMLFNARRRPHGPWLIERKLLRQLWTDTWTNFLPSSLQWSAATRTESIVKSVSSYLGKYLSKGSPAATSSAPTTQRTSLLPQWYAVSKCVRNWVNAATLKSSTIGTFLFESLREGDPSLTWYSHIYLELASGSVVPIVCFGSSKYKNLNIPPP